MEDAHLNAFKKKYPDLPVLFNHMESNRKEEDTIDVLAQAMLTGDSNYDLYMINGETEGFVNLREKGFCADLSGNEALVQIVDRMYPFLQEMVKKGDGLYGIPMLYKGEAGLAYYPEMWEAAGLLPDELPRTLLEFLGFIRDWSRGDSREGYTILGDVISHKETLLQFVIDQYTAYYEGTEKELAFDTPLFRKLMDALEEIDYGAMDPGVPIDGKQQDMWSVESRRIALFDITTPSLTLGGGEYATPLILPMDQGMEIVLGVTLEVFFINAKSPNGQAAADYIEAYFDNLPPGRKIMLFPDENEPVLYPNFEETLANWYDYIAFWEKELAENPFYQEYPNQLRNTQDDIAETKAKIANADDLKWWYSSEQISRFRELAAYAYVSGRDGLSYSDKKGNSYLATPIQRYIEGNISKDTFHLEINRIAEMIRLEQGYYGMNP